MGRKKCPRDKVDLTDSGRPLSRCGARILRRARRTEANGRIRLGMGTGHDAAVTRGRLSGVAADARDVDQEPMNVRMLILIAISSLLAVSGDCLVKWSLSFSGSRRIALAGSGAAVYASMATVWMRVFRYGSFASATLTYGSLTSLLWVASALVLFRETPTAREWAGIALAAMAIVILSTPISPK
jgi:uncharacterized membrane protein